MNVKRHTNKTRNKIHLCKEIRELCSCATLVLACARGILPGAFSGKENRLRTPRDSMGSPADADHALGYPQSK